MELGPSDRYRFSENNSTLFISPVKKEDRGSYRCVASNPVSRGRHSQAAELVVYCEWDPGCVVHMCRGCVCSEIRLYANATFICMGGE